MDMGRIFDWDHGVCAVDFDRSAYEHGAYNAEHQRSFTAGQSKHRRHDNRFTPPRKERRVGVTAAREAIF